MQPSDLNIISIEHLAEAMAVAAEREDSDEESCEESVTQPRYRSYR